MEKQKRIRALLSEPDNDLDNIIDTVGDLRPGEMIQVQINDDKHAAIIDIRLRQEFPATGYMMESFVSNEVRYAYIYIQEEADREQAEA